MARLERPFGEPLRRVLRARFPRGWQLARQGWWNGWGHLGWIAARTGLLSDQPYDAGFWDHHDQDDLTGLARGLLALAPWTSLIDVGCGSGTLLRELGRLAPEARLAGVDGSPVALERARARGLSVSQVDLGGGGGELRALAARLGRYDVATSLEVGEHLPVWSARPLVELLTLLAPRVVFSAAQPGQGGHHHIHERGLEYWAGLFRRLGWVRDQSATDTLRGALGAAPRLPEYYARNVQVFRPA